MIADNPFDDTIGNVVRDRSVFEDGGHAWVLARDEVRWFYECLRCGDRAHILSIEDMNKAVEHSYAYMPLRHRAPWNAGWPKRMLQADGTIVEEPRSPYPSCPDAGAPLPDMSDFENLSVKDPGRSRR